MLSERFSVQGTCSVTVLENLPRNPQHSSGPSAHADQGAHSTSHLRTLCLLGSCFLQREEYHTHLAVLYLDEVLQHRPGASGKGAEVTETQAKLRRLLQKSDLYRVHFLMGEEDPDIFSIDTSAVGWGACGEWG